MVVCVALGADGSVGGGWGRADRVAVARVDEGEHHARIAHFLIEHGVQKIVTGRMGEGMVRMLERLPAQSPR